MSIVKKVQIICQEIQKYSKLIPQPVLFTIVDMLWCGLRYGASPKNYYIFEFYRVRRHEDRATFLTHRFSNKLMEKLNAEREPDVLYDKLAFAQYFNEFYGRGCFPSETISADSLHPYIGQRIIYKPLRGGQGQGIQVFSLSEANLSDTAKAICMLPQGIVETWINQHPALSALNPTCVNPIRIVSILHDGQVHIIGATLTVGKAHAEFANASVNAYFALVETGTGIVSSNGYQYGGTMHVTHPDYGIKFKGLQIPNWDQIISIVTEAAKTIPQIGYIGWDVAVTEDGAVLIEGNNDPGYTAMQLPALTESNHGILPLIKPFL